MNKRHLHIYQTPITREVWACFYYPSNPNLLGNKYKVDTPERARRLQELERNPGLEISYSLLPTNDNYPAVNVFVRRKRPALLPTPNLSAVLAFEHMRGGKI